MSRILQILSDIKCIFSKKYHNPRKTKLFFDYLRIAFKELICKKITFKEERFLSFNFEVGDYHSFFIMFREIFIHHTYYFKTTAVAPRILDAGGNKGVTVLYFKYLYPEAVITVFEPLPQLASLLKRNVEKNNLKNVTVVESAVSNKKGEIVLHFPSAKVYGGWATTKENSVKKPQDMWQEVTVPTVLLSDYITETIDFLKMDIEGAEGVVFKELFEKNKLPLIKEIKLEYHYNKTDENKLSELFKILESENFHIIIFNCEADTSSFAVLDKKFYYFMIRANRTLT